MENQDKEKKIKDQEDLKAQQDTKDHKEQKEKHKGLDPDPETLHKTDPQEHMSGPVSSLVQKTKKTVEEADDITKKEAEEKREKNM